MSGKAIVELSKSCDWTGWGSRCGGDRYADAFSKAVRFEGGEGENETIIMERCRTPVNANYGEESSHLSWINSPLGEML